MSVVLSVEEVGPCRKQLKIEVPAPAVEAESNRVVSEYAKKARIPGFRKGKAPAAVVRRQFKDEIRQELLDRLVPRYWRQAAAEKSIEPLGQPAVESIEEILAGAPLVFTAVVEVRPEIELRNTSDFSLPEPETEPTESEIEEFLTQLRRSHAEWEPVDRPAATGDRVKVEVTETSSEGAEPQPAEFELGAPGVWEELNLAVTGLTFGQSGTFTRTEGEGEEARERSFSVRVDSVREAKLPALDEEFAKHMGDYADVAALREEVSMRIRRGKADDARAERERALLDQLTERHPMELPQGVVHAEIESLLREYAEGLARRGVDLEHAGIDWQKLGEEMRSHAERRVKARLLLDAIAEKESIKVSEEEFEQALGVLAKVQGVPSGALRQRLDEAGELPSFRGRMRREKAIRYLLGERESAPEAAPESGAEAE